AEQRLHLPPGACARRDEFQIAVATHGRPPRPYCCRFSTTCSRRTAAARTARSTSSRAPPARSQARTSLTPGGGSTTRTAGARARRDAAAPAPPRPARAPPPPPPRGPPRPPESAPRAPPAGAGRPPRHVGEPHVQQRRGVGRPLADEQPGAGHVGLGQEEPLP